MHSKNSSHIWLILKIITIFQNKGEINKVERIHHQETCTTKNVKGSPSGRKRIIPVRNMGLYKGKRAPRGYKFH